MPHPPVSPWIMRPRWPRCSTPCARAGAGNTGATRRPRESCRSLTAADRADGSGRRFTELLRRLIQGHLGQRGAQEPIRERVVGEDLAQSTCSRKTEHITHVQLDLIEGRNPRFSRIFDRCDDTVAVAVQLVGDQGGLFGPDQPVKRHSVTLKQQRIRVGWIKTPSKWYAADRVSQSKVAGLAGIRRQEFIDASSGYRMSPRLSGCLTALNIVTTL